METGSDAGGFNTPPTIADDVTPAIAVIGTTSIYEIPEI